MNSMELIRKFCSYDLDIAIQTTNKLGAFNNKQIEFIENWIKDEIEDSRSRTFKGIITDILFSKDYKSIIIKMDRTTSFNLDGL